MEVQATSTSQIVDLEGVPCRIWKAVTAEGIPCFMYVHRVAVESRHDCAAFDRELAEQHVPAFFPVPLEDPDHE